MSHLVKIHALINTVMFSIAFMLDKGYTSLLSMNILLIIIVILSTKIYFDIKNDLPNKGDYEVISDPIPIQNKEITNDQSKPSNKPSSKSSLTTRDLDLFTSEMNEFNHFLKVINMAIESSGDISRVFTENDRLLTIQSWKRSIEQEPERLIEVDNLIYKQVPKLSELISLYLEISRRDLICDESISVLEEALDAMAIVADEIKEDYFIYNKRELIKLKDSIQQVKRESSKESEGLYNES